MGRRSTIRARGHMQKALTFERVQVPVFPYLFLVSGLSRSRLTTDGHKCERTLAGEYCFETLSVHKYKSKPQKAKYI
jgi:hypothetical protein